MSKKTTITDACRWLSEHACDIPECPEMPPLFATYMAGVQQQLKFGERFGYWLHDKHPKVFKKWFIHWWKKHPDAWDMVYDGAEERIDRLTFNPEKP